MSDEFFFSASTPLGFSVSVTPDYWRLIVSVKHPIMNGREDFVKGTLTNPDEIRRSRSDANVYLFYRQEKERRWVCAVARQNNEGGFLITSYPTDAIKEGERVWPR